MLDIHAELNRLQYGKTKRYIRLNPMPFGLGMQITGRVHTLLIGLAFGRKSIISPHNDPYTPIYSQMYSNFEPSNHPEKLVDPTVDQVEDGLYYHQSNVWIGDPKISAIFRKHLCDKLGWPADRWYEIEGKVFDWLPVTDEMKTFCLRKEKELRVDRDTLGLHYRRGDKKNESAYVPTQVYQHALFSVHQKWKFKKLFIASDSANAIDEIHPPEGVEVIFDYDEKRYNNANHSMLINNPDLALEETSTAFKNIWLLSRCGAVVGQDNAHFSTLAYASIAAHSGGGRGALIDGRIALKKSPILAAYYKLKVAVRAQLRRCLPWATSSSRLRRLKNRGKVGT